VEAGQLEKFNAVYGSLLKASMTTLRKRDKKREKQRSEQAARRRKKMTEPVVVEGPKRGNGRKIRQRKIKAAVKQQEAQKKFRERELTKEAVQIDMEL
jgi:signal recognition particle subunit SRP14